ncbi:hypothetical protein K7X08_014332 [Anisodus acutangulus]|uniref:RING-type E3 ubiquitin transferase n=1 Tax=Anisodus acutangulus TaxID=402998 RepID=A0A9Q1R313_9SOLA|nr:hypothetical protein K7X08_014332 [Anisodus acutangulus]
MGQKLSCVQQQSHEHELFIAVQKGELEKVEAMVNEDPNVLLHLTTVRGKLSVLHVSAANGQIEVLCMLLDRGVNADILNRHKQTPLILAAMHGYVSCLERLIQRGANILTFDSLHGRTCLHYVAYHGHSDCLQSILASAHPAPVAQSWGFARFVNIRDRSGATPLHLAARHGRPACVRILLSNEALVCASSGGYGRPGSTPLHLAAREGSLDCVRELLAWGADRLYRDSSGLTYSEYEVITKRTPYMVALKYKHEACAALLNPSSPEPLTWPLPLKEKLLLEKTAVSHTSPSHCDSGLDLDDFEGSDFELCCICFEQACTIEIQKCGHQMCAHCTLVLCCHNKPNPASNSEKVPVCPFCRSDITHLAVVRNKIDTYVEVLSPSRPRKSRTSFSLTEGGGGGSSSSSLRVLSPLASFGKLGGRHSGKISAETIEVFAKP